jgi:hypothetical protein
MDSSYSRQYSLSRIEFQSDCDGGDDSKIFARKFPILGWVPIGFYIPDCSSKYDLRKQIEKRGGMVTKYEAFGYQLKPEKECNDSRKFYTGNIYSWKWIKTWIKRGRFIEDNENFCLGFNSNYQLKTITKKRTPYTIIEVLKMFDLAKKDIDYSNRSVKFWDEVEKKNVIPDRTSQSLRTAWRKFSKYGEEQFIKEALKDQKIRFSHQFASVPCVNSQASLRKPTELSSSVDVSRQDPERLLESQLDMEILSSKEISEMEPDEDQEQLEFLLAVDDLQSAIAFNETDDRTYSLKAPKITRSNKLHSLYDNRDDILRNEERKRLSTNSLQNSEEKKTEVTNKDEMYLLPDTTSIYNQEDLIDFLKRDCQITIHRDYTKNERCVQSRTGQNKQKEQQFFEKLSKELRELAKKYGKEMDELHMLFMEVSWDINELKNLLQGEKPGKWSMLEDLAIQSEPDSMEFHSLIDTKGGSEVLKRKKFLEI